MNRIKNCFEELNIKWTDDKAVKFEGYMDEIVRLNESINLTSITDRDEFITKHFIDSLTCADCEEFDEADDIIDVGTGGGFPGVPLAIAFPNKRFVLMDSLNKRINIINEICSKLGINNVKAVHGRAEEMARRGDMREKFDLCVSRAVAGMSTLSEYCLPFVKVGGTFIAYKGPNCRDEIEAAEYAIEQLGGEVYGVFYNELKDLELDHVLVYVAKINPTPKKYPRKPGTPAKQPL
ncbi:MAG: 16S rRNA (guanine(527)-N(7))-methyltransferase RsmG [Bacillota bacterium]|nr:16S rRNA (guanine(527)-N(7))-methyltransferase RsmG [Bacillota bacterium]